MEYKLITNNENETKEFAKKVSEILREEIEKENLKK